MHLLGLPGNLAVAADYGVAVRRDAPPPASEFIAYLHGAEGPPASVILLALVPQKLIGWTRAPRPDEAAYLPDAVVSLPTLGRLTGRGNTANVEVVMRAKPDLIVDVGATSATFVTLAARVEQQTGVPYLLFDGSPAGPTA
jgi:ABC-type Fe3+-hydroxamate transport system substrate-binding protein